jgi:hypothetical protein
MSHERRTDGEETDNGGCDTGLKTNENCEAAYEFNQTDDNSRNGWEWEAKASKVTRGARNGSELAVAGNDEEDRKKDAGNERNNAIGLWSDRGHGGYLLLNCGIN